MEQIVIIGAGQAGFTLASTLRKEGYEGAIHLIGDEKALPYQRPPLSKKYLLGEMSADRLTFRDQDFFDEEKITLHLGEQVTKIDRAAKQVELSSGKKLAYDKLALTTGSSARPLPASLREGVEAERLHVIRSLADIDRLQPQFTKGARLLVIGGGYIGLEAAAVARQSGLEVSLVEMQERLLARVTSPATSDYFAKLHQSHDVSLHLGSGLKGLEQRDGAVVAHLENGSEIAADLVIVGIGGMANITLAQDAGLEVEAGICVNKAAQSSDADIYATGDCAFFPYRGAMIRLESVQNAIDQSIVAAQSMLGQDVTYDPSVWFWSDQYDIKLQIAGLSHADDQMVVRAGKTEASRSHWYYRDGKLVCVEAISDPRSYMMGKRWLEAGLSPAMDQIGDAELDLKAIKP